MELHYSFEPEGKANVAKAMGKDLNVSFKDTVIICTKLRGMMLNDASRLLKGVISLNTLIPFGRFNRGIGHRRVSGKNNIAKYPEKAAGKVLKVLKNAETNAEYRGLDPERLKIVHIQAQKGPIRRKRRPQGRWRPWKTEFVSVQVVAQQLSETPPRSFDSKAVELPEIQEKIQEKAKEETKLD